MPKYSFDVRQTNIVKGFLILAMVFHHVFHWSMEWYLTNLAGGEASELLLQLAKYGKVCVGGFVFLSAYGITRKLMRKLKQDNVLIIERLVKLYFMFWPIFLLGVVGTIIWGNVPLGELYVNPVDGEFSWLQLAADMLGLADLAQTPTMNASWWYMSVALYIIFAVPVYNRLYTRFGLGFVGVVCILPYAVRLPYAATLLTLPGLAVFFAREDIFENLKRMGRDKLWKHILQWIVALVVLYASYEWYKTFQELPMVSPFQTLACIFFCYIVLADIPLLRCVLEFLGRYSANIFFVHTFLYYHWFTYSIYSLGNKCLVYMVVLIGSLLISIAIEVIKKLTGYTKLEHWVIECLTGYACRTGNVVLDENNIKNNIKNGKKSELIVDNRVE